MTTSEKKNALNKQSKLLQKITEKEEPKTGRRKEESNLELWCGGRSVYLFVHGWHRRLHP
jgi:hypothetical protein